MPDQENCERCDWALKSLDYLWDLAQRATDLVEAHREGYEDAFNRYETAAVGTDPLVFAEVEDEYAAVLEHFNQLQLESVAVQTLVVRALREQAAEFLAHAGEKKPVFRVVP